MDLGITGRKALVCASSTGLGFACAQALAAEGCKVWINGRDAARLQAAAQKLRSVGRADVTPVVADLNTEDGRRALVAACPDADILINNNAGPPPGDWRTWRHADWLAALESNMLAAIDLITALVPGMQQRRFGRVVNITSAMVKQPWPTMGLSAAARAGLTAFCKTVALEVAADNVTLNNLLPERIDTGRQEFMARKLMEREGISREEARARFASSIAARRMGRPEEVGALCAYLCGDQSGFMSGQNLQVDGGSYPGLV